MWDTTAKLYPGAQSFIATIMIDTSRCLWGELSYPARDPAAAFESIFTLFEDFTYEVKLRVFAPAPSRRSKVPASIFFYIPTLRPAPCASGPYLHEVSTEVQLSFGGPARITVPVFFTLVFFTGSVVSSAQMYLRWFSCSASTTTVIALQFSSSL